MIISEVFNLYQKKKIVAGGLSLSTAENYKNTMKLLIRQFGDVEISSLTDMDYANFQLNLMKYQKLNTVRMNMISIHAVLEYCKENEIQAMNPAKLVIPKKEKAKIEYLTSDDMDKFLFVMSKPKRGYANINRLRNIAMVEMLYATGLRISELCALNRDSFYDGQCVVIGKSKYPRVVYITKRAQDALQAYLDARTDNNEAMFLSNETKKRMTPGVARLAFRNACKRAGCGRVHPHMLRHTYATTMLSKGVDLRYIADLLGHVSIETTRVYTHYENPQLKAVYHKAMGN